MPDNYSISLEGIRVAERSLNRVAQNIAVGRSLGHSERAPASPGMVQLSSADPVTEASTGGVIDYAREIVTVIEVEIGAAASLKVTATQQQLDKNALDLLA